MLLDESFKDQKIHWAMDLSKVGLWEYFPDENKLFWSRQTYKIHGLSEGKPIDVDTAILFYQEKDREKITNAVRACLDQGTEYDLTLGINDTSGMYRPIRTMGRRVVSDDGVVRLEGIFQDLSTIEDLKHSIDVAMHKMREYSDLIDKTSITAGTNAKGLIIHVNDKFCEISGYSREELIGKSHSILNSGFHPKSFFVDLWKQIASGKDWRGQIKNKAKDGSYYWVETLIHPSRNASGRVTGYLSIRTDITKQKEKEEINLKNSRLIAIGEASAQIMHDVMNPLAIIQGNGHRLKKLKKDHNFDEKRQNISPAIEEGVERIRSIFNDMRSILVDEVDMVALDLAEVVRESVLFVEQVLKTHEVKLENTIDQPQKIIGNRNLLVQVFTNLIKNSAEAVADLEDRWVRLESVNIGKHTYVRVIDSGAGIPKEIQEHMFDSFFTTKRDKGGSGIGLGLCRKIIDMHGGDLKVNEVNDHTEIDVIFKHQPPT